MNFRHLNDQQRQDYRDLGYLHLPSLISNTMTHQLMASFQEIKQKSVPLLRQRTVTYEPHEFTVCGFVENALLDVHRNDIINDELFSSSARAVFSDKGLLTAVSDLIGDRCALVQSMYFESSKGTPEHFDKYFLGSKERSALIGVWIALEDIEDCAGEFYVYPNSHRNSFDGSQHQNELVDLVERYAQSSSIGVDAYQRGNGKTQIKSVIDCKRILATIIEKAGWEKYYPRMKKGDVLLFSSSTLHGSSTPSPQHRSRNSLTGHFIGLGQNEIRFGARTEPLSIVESDGLLIHMSKRYEFQSQPNQY